MRASMPCSGWCGIETAPGRRERATQPPELFEVGLGERLEALAPRRRELQTHDSVILWVPDPLDELGGDGPVDQADGTVVAEEQVVGHLADGWATAVGVPPDGQQQLMLGRGQPRSFRLLLAPSEKTT